ncbi:uncharacterized protein BX663DRAFT_494254 [Cokeromyces recurvatus]|uniref:uncharacterized protein n=1 Tax=Cokeromyces recurvatus TaxID=90255 RepID=UPI00221FF6B7|nr:uncharacterized protein BX663DRAFT_494254 [Cokeromyces recurvatus]KAI7906933.1 hypothetical protein BX663DRAFT_494254 [Cokeromyces recurvatus]
MFTSNQMDYQCPIDDEGSDMDVSSGDEDYTTNNMSGGSLYGISNNHRQQRSVQTRNTTVNSYSQNFSRSEIDSSRFISVDDSDDSDDSYHTAPSSPMTISEEIEMETPKKIKQAVEKRDDHDALDREFARLTKMYEDVLKQEEEIKNLIEEKKKKLQVQQLEIQVRRSIKRNREIPKKSEQAESSTLALKKKTKLDNTPLKNVNSSPLVNASVSHTPSPMAIVLDAHASNPMVSTSTASTSNPMVNTSIASMSNSISNSLRSENKQKSTTRKENLNCIYKQQNEHSNNGRSNVSNSQSTSITQSPLIVDLTKDDMEIDSNKPYRSRLETAKIDVPFSDVYQGEKYKNIQNQLPSTSTSESQRGLQNKLKRGKSPDIQQFSMRVLDGMTEKEIRSMIRRSHIIGHVSLKQMHIQLCDLRQRALESPLTYVQKVHAEVLVALIMSLCHEKGEHIPRKNKGVGRHMRPSSKLVLGPEFYGHPDTLDYETYPLSKGKLNDAITYFRNMEVNPFMPPARLNTLPDNIKKKVMKYFDNVGYWKDSVTKKDKKKIKKLVEKHQCDLLDKKKKVYSIISSNSSSSTEFTAQSSSTASSTLNHQLEGTSTDFATANTNPASPIKPNEQISEAAVTSTRQDTVINSPLSSVKNASHNKSNEAESSNKVACANQSSSSITPYIKSQETVSKSDVNKASNFQPYHSALSSLGISFNQQQETQAYNKNTTEFNRESTHQRNSSKGKNKQKMITTDILCEAESSGGICRDKNCMFVHFSDFM